jgi:hypothetical protein
MNAIKYSTVVQAGGKVQLDLQDSLEGTPIEVIVLFSSDLDKSNDSLLSASESSLEFWDNPVDDEVWNTLNPRTIH